MPQILLREATLYFDESGDRENERAILLVHGTAGSTLFVRPQLEEFGRDYRVIAPDLRGHGRSSRGARHGITDFADDLDELARRLRLRRVLVAGHSLGGLVALELAARGADWLAGIAMIDVPLCIPPEVAAALAPHGEAFGGEGHVEAVRSFATHFFFRPDADPALRDPIVHAVAEYPQDLFVELWEAVGAYDAEAAGKQAKVPGLFIHSSVPADLDRFAGAYPDLAIEHLEETGHFSPLERPDEVNRILRVFAERVLPAQAALARTVETIASSPRSRLM